MKSPALKLLAVVLLAALGLRLVAGWWWQSRLEGPLFFGDSQSYWDLARTIVRGEPYAIGRDRALVFRTPGYPLLLAPLFLAGGDYPPVLWARALSAVLDTLAVAGVGWVAWRLFDPRAGLVAAALAALYPGSIAVGVLVLSEAPFCPLMLLHLGLWMAAWQSPTARRAAGLAVAAGVAAGLATLVRPSWLLFVPFGVGIGLAASAHRRRHLGLGTAMLAGLILTMLPWWVRNALATGRFVPTTLQVGASLYDGWNPQATGASEMSFVERFAAQERCRFEAEARPGDESFEVRLDRRLRQEALAWAREHPAEVARLAVVKLGRMWNVWPNDAGMSSGPVRIAMAVSYVPIVLVALVGAAGTIRRGWPYVLCWLPAAYFSLLHMVFVSSIRYRQPAMLGLMVLAGGAVSFWLGQRAGAAGVSGRQEPPA